MTTSNHPFRDDRVRIEIGDPLPDPLLYDAKTYQARLIEKYDERAAAITPPEWAQKLLDKDSSLGDSVRGPHRSKGPMLLFYIFYVAMNVFFVILAKEKFLKLAWSAFAVTLLMSLWRIFRKMSNIKRLQSAYAASGKRWTMDPHDRRLDLKDDPRQPKITFKTARDELDYAVSSLTRPAIDALQKALSENATKRQDAQHTRLKAPSGPSDGSEVETLVHEELRLLARRNALFELRDKIDHSVTEALDDLQKALETGFPSHLARAEVSRNWVIRKLEDFRRLAARPLEDPMAAPLCYCETEEAPPPTRAEES